mmetsp:Transcript_54226/g.65230  ORF Transcript_54226/g.65230 Transcript_54226/m.65230 type:complete len:81 (+) Transcript_54226:232-474(+)
MFATTQLCGCSKYAYVVTDVAGSKQGADTNKATGRTRLVWANVNASLLSRKKNDIRALAAKSKMQHIPFLRLKVDASSER